MPNLNTWGEIQNMLKIEYHWKHVLWIAISKLMQISLFDTSNLHKYSISKCIWNAQFIRKYFNKLEFNWFRFLLILIFSFVNQNALQSSFGILYIFWNLWTHYSNLNAKANVTFVSLKSFNVHYEWWRICIRIKV